MHVLAKLNTEEQFSQARVQNTTCVCEEAA
jgi:hypothetical protein